MTIPNGNMHAWHIFFRGYHFVQPTATRKIIPKGMQSIRINLTYTFRGGCYRGRASTRPYTACCKSTKYAKITSKNTPRLHRVAVGATGRSPAHPHGALTRIFRGCCHRGRASTRPYIAYCKSTKYAGTTSTKIHHGFTSRSCRGDWEVARHIRMAHPRRSRGRCHRGRASTRPYIACCTSTKYTGITSTKHTTGYIA